MNVRSSQFPCREHDPRACARWTAPDLLRALLPFCLLAIWGSEAVLRAQPRTIQSFVADQSKWPDLVGTAWHLEGRYSLFGDREMRFANCNLPFVFSGKISVPRERSNVVEVTGRLEKENGRLQFRVESLKSHPSDLEVVAAKRSEIDTRRPDDWYKVADWARNRGEFYKDAELLQEVDNLNRHGLLTEYRSIDPGNEQAHLAIVAKARRLKLDENLIVDMLHEGLRAQFEKHRRQASSEPALASLSVRIRKELPGAMRELDEYPEDLATEYAAEPKQLHAAADPARRQVLHRLFYLETMLERINAAARPDGSNGIEIAARIAAEIPERPELVTFHERRELDYRIKRVPLMARQEMLSLVRELESRDDPDRAKLVKQQWLQAREPLLREDGARGLVDLAEDWISLLNDRETAAEFYMAAWAANRDYEPAQQWLEANDFVFAAGKWHRRDEAPQTADLAMDRAIREGRILTGMSDAQVRAALGARPDAVTRFATSGRITELWVFESAGIVVRLSRRNRNEPSRVDAIDALRNSISADVD